MRAFWYVALGIFVVGAVPSLVQAADNTAPEGFVALFNGKDLTGWKGLLRSPLDNPSKRAAATPEKLAEAQKEADELMRKTWRVEDGALVYNGKGRSLCTAKDYGDFEMWVDWWIPDYADSGIYLRGSPQVQIWDPYTQPVHNTLAVVGSGGLFNNTKHPSKPLKVADKPIGQWNTFYIKMVGDKVTVKLNGELVVDNVVLENYWERDKPIYPTGQIELQHHNDPIRFKNIYMRELPGDKQ